jgi:hypothetical protein
MDIVKKILPAWLRDWLVRKRRQYKLYSRVNFGDFDRTSPISRVFGLDRGLPIDRYYIEKFLEANSRHIQGRVLEMGDPFYIKKFGNGNVSQIDVMNVIEGNPDATIVADLTDADHVPSNQFDCIIFTQSLQMIYELKVALHTLHHLLKPGGKLLMTSAGISKIARRLGTDDWGEYWHLTTQSAEALISESFVGGECEVRSLGNVFSAICFLHGLSAEELPASKLDVCDPNYEVIITVVATKSHLRSSADTG